MTRPSPRGGISAPLLPTHWGGCSRWPGRKLFQSPWHSHTYWRGGKVNCPRLRGERAGGFRGTCAPLVLKIIAAFVLLQCSTLQRDQRSRVMWKGKRLVRNREVRRTDGDAACLALYIADLLQYFNLTNLQVKWKAFRKEKRHVFYFQHWK